jgi:heme ABC exporter ATP-binding subunit CcmA
VIRLDDVRVVYGRTVALDRISLDLGEGIVGLFGPNGSGKSTLLKVIAGFVRPAGGAALAEGSPIRLADEAWRRHVGYAGHEPGLYARLSVRENLVLFARLYDTPDTRVDAVLRQLGLSERASMRVDALSAGLKRRASVARALVHDPRVLLLDEPYANLDDDAADLVSAALADWRRPGRLALVATHGAKRVKAFADAGVVLKQARVVSHRIRTGPRSSTPVEELEEETT